MINFIVNLAMEPTEMGVVLKQRQEVDCYGRWLVGCRKCQKCGELYGTAES